MTQILKSSTLLVLVGAAIALIGVLLLPVPGSAATSTVNRPVAVSMHRIDAVPAQQPAVVEAPEALNAPEASGLGTDFGIVTLALGEGTDYTQAQVDAVLASADRICEGRTAGVPHEVMAQTVAQESGMAPRQAEAFVSEVLVTRCGV